MIVVVGSRHDAAAAGLLESWPQAALCSAQDLTTPGWSWHVPAGADSRWVVDGRVVPDTAVSGVFVRRSTVYPEELLSTHPDDRHYLAAEAHAFLVFVLASSGARLAQPVFDGAYGDEALQPDRWMPIAARLGIAVAPLRLASGRALASPEHCVIVEAVGERAFGAGTARQHQAACGLLRGLGLCSASVVFDEQERLVTLSATRPPADRDALVALGRLLAGDAP
jgi:hypothetical protein